MKWIILLFLHSLSLKTSGQSWSIYLSFYFLYTFHISFSWHSSGSASFWSCFYYLTSLSEKYPMVEPEFKLKSFKLVIKDISSEPRVRHIYTYLINNVSNFNKTINYMSLGWDLLCSRLKRFIKRLSSDSDRYWKFHWIPL